MLFDLEKLRGNYRHENPLDEARQLVNAVRKLPSLFPPEATLVPGSQEDRDIRGYLSRAGITFQIESILTVYPSFRVSIDETEFAGFGIRVEPNGTEDYSRALVILVPHSPYIQQIMSQRRGATLSRVNTSFSEQEGLRLSTTLAHSILDLAKS